MSVDLQQRDASLAAASHRARAVCKRIERGVLRTLPAPANHTDFQHSRLFYGGRRRSRDRTLQRHRQRHAVGPQNDPHRRIELRSRLRIGTQRRHFRRPRLGHVTLVLNHQKIRRKPHIKPFLLDFKRLLLQLARLRSRLISRLRSLQRDESILDLNANGIFQLFGADLRLAQRQFVASEVGLSGAVAQRQREIEADRIRRIIAFQDLRKRRAIAIAVTEDRIRAGSDRTGRYREQRVRGAGKTVFDMFATRSSSGRSSLRVPFSVSSDISSCD